MWSRRDNPRSRRAAEFWTRCKGAMVENGRPIKKRVTVVESAENEGADGHRHHDVGQWEWHLRSTRGTVWVPERCPGNAAGHNVFTWLLASKANSLWTVRDEGMNPFLYWAYRIVSYRIVWLSPTLQNNANISMISMIQMLLTSLYTWTVYFAHHRPRLQTSFRLQPNSCGAKVCHEIRRFQHCLECIMLDTQYAYACLPSVAQ